ncbi:MAG: hypothetical protein AB8H86_08685 [Polyangiales bacterium]
MARTVCALLVATLTLTAGVASAQSEEPEISAEEPEISAEERERDARDLFSLASRHYETGRLAEAIDEFARAYELFPLPALQYNLYLAYRDSGDVARSTSSLRLYLETEETMDPERRSSLERRLATLEARQASESTSTTGANAPGDNQPRPVVETEPVAPTPEPVEAPAEQSGGMSPVIGGVVLGVGGALLVGALIEGLVANGKNGELDELCNDAGLCERDQHDAIVSSFETHRNVAWGLLYAGAAVAATGTVLLLLSGGDESEESAGAGFTCDPEGCLGTVSGRF